MKNWLHVWLQLLINELTQLWSSDALTCDVSTKQNFPIRATLIWTINDFLAYGMVSSWSTHGKLTCSYCMENNKAFMITNGGKTSFFYCHRLCLPTDHRYKKNKKDLFLVELKRMLHSYVFPMKSCMTLCQSMLTLCLFPIR